MIQCASLSMTLPRIFFSYLYAKPIAITICLIALCATPFAHVKGVIAQSASPTPVLRATPRPRLQATAVLRPTAATTAAATPTATRTSTSTPIPRPTSSPTVTGERYQLEQQVESKELPEIALVARGALLTQDELIVTVAFVNQTEEPLRFSFITPVEVERIRLVDRSGTPHVATAADQSWTAVQPDDGFAPGGANVGTITFARPIGPGPYQLNGIFDYAALDVALTQSQAETTALTVPNGTYRVDTTTFTSDEVLEPLRLNVRSVTIDREEVRFTIAFVNTGYRQYGLRLGPTGMDATLLDTDRRQFAPIAVSDSLAEKITPAEGIAPNDAYTGTIAFSRPPAFSELRFIFAQYSPVILTFGADGLIESQLVAGSDGRPRVTPTPQADVALYQQLSAGLAEQAEALRAGEIEAFLSGVESDLRPTLAEPFRQLATMPLDSLTFTIVPTTTLPMRATERLTGLPVVLRYTFAGVPRDNVFIHDFAADFVRQVDGQQAASSQVDNEVNPQWQLTALTPKNNTPFWWTGAVTSYESPHFLIFTRPDTTTALETLATEVEAAYTFVQEQGLSLEERYVAYFTGPAETFATFTGATSPDILGVALSRYQINVETIDVVSRAFYINGSNFVETGQPNLGQTHSGQVAQRQSTITHELVHLALANRARPFTPPWLAEGVAVYYAGQDTAADRSPRYNEERLPTIDLRTLTGLPSLGIHDITSETTSYRYLYSGAVIAYLIDTYGEEALLAFYRSYADVPVADVQDRLPLYGSPLAQDRAFQQLSVDVTETALATNFDLTLTTLEEAVKDWLLRE